MTPSPQTLLVPPRLGLWFPAPQLLSTTSYAAWIAKGVTVVEELHDDVFGRTFVIADPDGNLIRVSSFD